MIVNMELVPIKDIKVTTASCGKENVLVQQSLVKSISTRGQVLPLVVDESLTLIHGHQVYLACKELEMKEVWCSIVKTSSNDELYLELNILHREVNPIKVFKKLVKCDLEKVFLPYSKSQMKSFIDLLSFDWSIFGKNRKKNIEGLF